MISPDAANTVQDFQNKLSHFEEVVEKRLGTETIEASREAANAASPEELEQTVRQSMDFVNRLVAAINNELTADSPEVQALMQEHYELSSKFQPVSKETYLASRELLRDAPDFYAILHPELPEFMYQAMGIYADRL